MGIPSVGFWSDNGGEFQNNEMAEFIDKYKLVLNFGAAHSPWSNGINERNHAVADIIMGKVKEGDKSLTDQQAVNIASWSHNTNVNKLGYTPLQLQVGKSIGLPGFTEGTIVTDSKFEYELVEKLVMNMKKAVEQFRIANFREKIQESVAQRVPKYRGRTYKTNEQVYVQLKDSKVWSGPVRVLVHDGNQVWVNYNGSLYKLSECKVQPLYNDGKEDEDSTTSFSSNDKVRFTDPKPEILSSRLKEADEEQGSTEKAEGVMTRQRKKKIMSKNEEFEENFYIKQLEHESLDTLVENILVVEIPTREHGRPDCIEAKSSEMENLLNFETFEEVKDNGQKTIDSRWILNEKQAHDGQKKKVKARLVAKGFQEEYKPQSDSPTVLRDSLKTFLVLAANEKFDLASVDITGAFLQGEKIEREVFLRPPPDIRKQKPGIIWKLNKSLYGLNDASRNFYFRVRPLLTEAGFQTSGQDEAYFYKYEKGELVGQVAVHVDDFIIAGSTKFVADVVTLVSETLRVSKVEYTSSGSLEWMFVRTKMAPYRSAWKLTLSLSKRFPCLEKERMVVLSLIWKGSCTGSMLENSYGCLKILDQTWLIQH